MFRYLLLALCAILLAGCEQQPQDKPETAPKVTLQKPLSNLEIKPFKLLQEPIEASLVETATEALPIWRKTADTKPTLVLFSNNPFLMPIPEPLQSRARDIARKGTPAEVKTLSVDISANPVLLHDMALSAAIEANFFSRVIWVLPQASEDLAQTLEFFKQQIQAAGFASAEETEKFLLDTNGFSGELRGTAFKVIPGTESLHINEPAVVHFDLSFFEPLYINEIKTPLYPLVATQLSNIKESNIPALSVTLSSSNLGGTIPLTVRFLGQDLKKLLKDPSLLKAPLSKFWFHRQQSLFLASFFRDDEILKHLLSMKEISPDDPSVLFALYSIHRELKMTDEALALLEKTAALDSIYAMEYQNLSNVAMKKGKPLAALEMLDKAAVYFPANPLIKLATADIQLQLGHRTKALELLLKLSALPWSDVYDSEMPTQLEKMIAAANQLPASKRD